MSNTTFKSTLNKDVERCGVLLEIIMIMMMTMAQIPLIRPCSIGINRLNRNRFELIRLMFLNRTLFQPFLVDMQ